jgi:hypothetical protein
MLRFFFDSHCPYAQRRAHNTRVRKQNFFPKHPQPILYSAAATARAAHIVSLSAFISSAKSLERTVDVELVVTNDLLDDALLLELGERLARQGSADLQAVDEDGGGDQTVGQDVFVKALMDGLVHDDGMLGLVLDCPLISASPPSAKVNRAYPFPWTTSSAASLLL